MSGAEVSSAAPAGTRRKRAAIKFLRPVLLRAQRAGCKHSATTAYASFGDATILQHLFTISIGISRACRIRSVSTPHVSPPRTSTSASPTKMISSGALSKLRRRERRPAGSGLCESRSSPQTTAEK
jgi:hypothetical protein